MWVSPFMPHSESISQPTGHGCFACSGGRTFEICIGERNIFLAVFAPQHLLSWGPTLHSFTSVGWESLHHSCGHQLPFTQPAFLISQSFQSPGKWIFSLVSFPLSCHSYCVPAVPVLEIFEEQVHVRNTAQSIKEGVFQEHITKKKLVLRRIDSYFTYVPSSKHFLLTIRTGFTAKQQFTSLGFPSRFCAVLEGLIRSTKIHY